jgi:hypothetical protein
MKILREADAWPIAIRNRIAAEKEAAAQQNSEQAKQARRDHNRKLSEDLVRPWSPLEFEKRMDKVLDDSLNGVNDYCLLNPTDPRYHAPVTAQRSLPGNDAGAASYAARQERKRKESRFVSNQLGRKK